MSYNELQWPTITYNERYKNDRQWCVSCGARLFPEMRHKQHALTWLWAHILRVFLGTFWIRQNKNRARSPVTGPELSIFGNVRNNSVTSHHGGLDISSSVERIRIGVEMCCISRFCRSLCPPFSDTTCNEEEMAGHLFTRWRTINGFEMLEKARFFF